MGANVYLASNFHSSFTNLAFQFNNGMKRNIPILGFIIGALTPLIGFAVVYFIFRNGAQSIADFFNTYWANNKTFAKLMTLSLLANLAPFVYCNSKRFDYTARGIFVATMLYVVFIVLLMFVW